ncbi:MAG: exodeoxyribonuclease VII small subunit [Chlamydiae bacterium]|nr:exodeoxyribonuclease VII small subunit [Chlamydiota bacterium]
MSNDVTITFESAYSRLEEILELMNTGKISLEDSLGLYEEADRLIVLCNTKLNQAEKKIEMLIKNRDSDLSFTEAGTPQTQDFSPNVYSTLANRDPLS